MIVGVASGLTHFLGDHVQKWVKKHEEDLMLQMSNSIIDDFREDFLFDMMGHFFVEYYPNYYDGIKTFLQIKVKHLENV